MALVISDTVDWTISAVRCSVIHGSNLEQNKRKQGSLFIQVVLQKAKRKERSENGLTVTPPVHIHLINSHTSAPEIWFEWVKKSIWLVISLNKFYLYREQECTVSLLVIIMTIPVSSNGGRPALPHICKIVGDVHFKF